jgi:NitT/TauT family transport system ATP-binding protein
MTSTESNSTSSHVGAPLVVAENMTVGYELEQQRQLLTALTDINLTIHEGEFMVLVGPSGCGKTTFINAVAGLLSVEKNVAMPFEFIAHPFSDKEIQEQVYQVIRNVGLDGFEKSFPHELSGGMRQRVGIARAMVTQPKLLLADEPFGALDAMTREVLQGQLEKLVMESGQTVIFITHSIDEAISLGDRIAVISHRPGTVREIVEVNIERPRLAEGEITQHPDYGPLRQHLWDLVKDEALGAKSEDVA